MPVMQALKPFSRLRSRPHLNAVQNMYLGRESQFKGILGKLISDYDVMRKSEDSFRDLGATVRSLTASTGSCSRTTPGIAVAVSLHGQVSAFLMSQRSTRLFKKMFLTVPCRVEIKVGYLH